MVVASSPSDVQTAAPGEAEKDFLTKSPLHRGGQHAKDSGR
jgi:hypothetical protein